MASTKRATKRFRGMTRWFILIGRRLTLTPCVASGSWAHVAQDIL